MDVGRIPAVDGFTDVGMPVQVVLIIHHRREAADEQERLAVVQQTHLVRGHKLPARGLHVGGVAAVLSLGLPMGPGVDGLLAQQLGDILMGALLVTAQIQERIAVAGDGLPAVLLVQSL